MRKKQSNKMADTGALDGGVSGGPAEKAVAKENCKAENSKPENAKPAENSKEREALKDAAKEAKEKEINDGGQTPSGDQKGCFGTGAELVCARTLAAEAAKKKELEEKRELGQLRELINVLGTLRTKGVLCDVIVTVESRRFKAHKALLAAGCGYFRTLFSQMEHQPSEGCKTEVIIQSRDVTADSFENMLDYVYTGKLRPLVWETIFETLACACYLQIKNAIQACTEFIDKAKSEGKLKFKDFFTISSMAGNYGVKELKETADKHIARDFSKISKTEEFLVHMSSQSLQDLLERNDLAISRERQVLEAVTRWLKHDWDTRKSFALPVLQKVRLGLVPIRNVIEGIDRQIREATECRDLYEELLERHALGEKSTGPLLQTHPEMLTPRKCRRENFAIKSYQQYFKSDARTGDHVAIAQQVVASAQHVTIPPPKPPRQAPIAVQQQRPKSAAKFSPRLFRYVVHVTWEKRVRGKTFKAFKPDFRHIHRRALPEVVVL